MSFLRYMTIYSACKYNDEVTLVRKRRPHIPGKWGKAVSDGNGYADYAHRLADIPNLDIQYIEDMLPGLKDMPDVNASDILTWHILATYGGTVADMDILFVDSVPSVDYDIGLIQYPKMRRRRSVYPVGFLQGKPNDIWQEMFDHAMRYAGGYDAHQCVGSDLLRDYVPKIKNSTLSVKWIPHTLVYPFSTGGIGNIIVVAAVKNTFTITRKIPSDCIGIHWYGGASQRYNNEITEENYKQYPCTLSRYIEQVLCH